MTAAAVVTGDSVIRRFTGVLEDDVRALSAIAAVGEETLAALPAKSERDSAQRQVAEDAFTACRVARRAFLARHLDAVYDLLTDCRTSYPRLPALVSAAAERFPGLVPSADQMAAERRHIQADKEGREIDHHKHDDVCDQDGKPLFRRKDDEPETVQKRLKTYHKQTEPLKDYYDERGLLRRFDGTRDKTEVHDHIRATLATLRLEERL